MQSGFCRETNQSVNQMKKVYLWQVLCTFVLTALAGTNVFSQQYLSETFNGNSLPAGWQNSDQGAEECLWMTHAPFNRGGFEEITMRGSNFLWVDSDSAGSSTVANESLTSPVINTNGATAVLLKFHHYYRAGGSIRQDTGIVEAFNGTSWVTMARYFETEGAGTAPVEKVINLSAVTNPNLRIRLRYVGNWAYFWAIDDLIVYSPAANDIGVVSMNQPGACGLPSNFQVTVKLANFGTQAQTGFPVSYQVNNQPVVTTTFSGSLPAQDTVDFTFPAPFTPSASGNYRFSVWTGLPSDGISQNDSIRNIVLNRATSGFQEVSLANFSGSNLSTSNPGWDEFNGSSPTFSGSSWDIPSAAQTTALGMPTAVVNLYFNDNQEWIVGPAINPAAGAELRFRLAITDFNGTGVDTMGSDDSLIVKVSTDCGQSWTNLRSFTRQTPLSNQLTGQTVSLAAYAGQNIRIAFYATDGTVNDLNDYDLHLAAMQVLVPSANDIGLSSLNLPAQNCGVPASFPVSVNVFNNGTQAISSLPLSYKIGSQAAVNQTFNLNLAPGANTTLEFSTQASNLVNGDNALTVYATLGGDGNSLNDTVRATVRKAPSFFAVQNFNGFTGDLPTNPTGWIEAAGINPTGTTSSWLQNTDSQQTFYGTTTAKVNLYSDFRNEWIISPAIQVEAGYVFRFKVAVSNWNDIQIDSMGSDDSLIVKISTNCGQTWTSVKSFTRADALPLQLTLQTIPLSAYVGQNIRIGMYGTDGNLDDANDYDVHIDDLEVIIPSAVDAGISQVLLPNATCGVASSQVVRMRIVNNGSETLANVPASYRINNNAPVSQTFNVNLATGESAIVAFDTPAQFATAGNYTLSVWTTMPGDLNATNDSVMNNQVTRFPSSFTAVGFTGFTGGNLGTVFPGWIEQTGSPTPTGTTSAWTNSTAAQTTSLGSATSRINFFTNFKRDWMISPPINPEAGMVLKFKVAVTNSGTAAIDSMGSDDTLKVMVSTDCGSTWRSVKNYSRSSNLGNLLSQQTVPLGAYAGQNIRIGFLAHEGTIDNTNDYDFHIDDVEVGIPVDNDLGISEIMFPNDPCSFPVSLTLKVGLTNFGAQPQTGFSVGYRLNGSTVANETYSGTLAPGQTVQYSFANPIALSPGGTYAFKVGTGLANDAFTANDSLSGTLTTNGPELAPVTFTGFTSTNLSVLSPGWDEATGVAFPAPGDATWNASTLTQTNVMGGTTARVGLFGNTKNEWITGPVFIPTAESAVQFRAAVTDRSATASDIMGSDDSLKVMISTDCGQTWNFLFALTDGNSLPNQLTPFSVSLAAYANQVCRIGFLASEGTVNDPQDYDLHIDDIKVGVVSRTADVLTSAVQVYPNPANDRFVVRAAGISEKTQVQVYGMDGRMVSVPTTRSANEVRFQTGSLAEGVYVVRMQSETGISVHRIVVKH
jgi:hypothetical protein